MGLVKLIKLYFNIFIMEKRNEDEILIYSIHNPASKKKQRIEVDL